MNVRRLLLTLIALFALLITSCAPESGRQDAVSISTGSVTGRYVDVGLAIARIVERSSATTGFTVRDRTSSGSVSNINSVIAGESEFGIAQADHQYEAVKGLGDWKDSGPQSQLRAVFGLYSEAVTLVAGGDAGILSISDLKGKRVDIGTVGSGTRQNAIEALRAAGIDWQTDIQATEENLDDRLSQFMRGEIDAFFFTSGHPNKEIKFATFSVRGARIIPIDNVGALVSTSPYYSPVIITAGTYPMSRGAADITTVGVQAALLTSASMPEEVVYQLTKAVFEDVRGSQNFRPEFEAIQLDLFLDGLTAPIHPGALRYYREAGIDVPAN